MLASIDTANYGFHIPAVPQNTATQAQSIQQQQGIPVIHSPNDPAFAALPAGAQFMTPDGKKRIKK